ncbi:hypothetical protein TSOC_012968, partial [Tetrabaena socialis]
LASAPSPPSSPPPSASAASGPFPDAPGAPGPGLLSLPDRLLQDILARVPGGSPGADGGAPCACAALRAAWREGLLHRAQSTVAALLAEYGEQALAATLYDRPGLLLLPGMQTATATGGGRGRGSGGRVWPALLRWAVVQVAAQWGCPPHEQATKLLELGMQKRDAALLRAVLGCTALRPYLCDSAWLAERLGRASIAGDPGEGVLRALLDSGVGACPEHQADRDEVLSYAVIVDEAGSARERRCRGRSRRSRGRCSSHHAAAKRRRMGVGSSEQRQRGWALCGHEAPAGAAPAEAKVEAGSGEDRAEGEDRTGCEEGGAWSDGSSAAQNTVPAAMAAGAHVPYDPVSCIATPAVMAAGAHMPYDPTSRLPRARRMAVGAMCKQLLDAGRLDWLRSRFRSAELVSYVGPEVTGENRLLLAVQPVLGPEAGLNGSIITT